MKDHLPVLIPLVPLAGAWLTLGLSWISYRLSRWTAYGLLLASLALEAEILPKILSGGPWHYSMGGWAPPWGIEWVVTPFSAFLAGLVLLLALLAYSYLGSFGLIAGLLKSRETLGGALFLVLVAGLLALVFTRDGFTLYLLLQLILVAAVGLVVCVNRQASEGGFYLLLGGSVGVSLVLAGFLFLYSTTGTLHLDDILAQLFIARNFSMPLAAGLFLACGFGCLFCVPSPLFFPRLLGQVPPFLLGFLSAGAVRTAVYLFFLSLFFVLDVPGMAHPPWLMGLECLWVLFFLAHFLYAAREKDFLHAVASLSVAQLAFPLAGFVAGNKSALTGSLMELLSQMPVVMGLFAAVGILSLKTTGAHPFSKLAGLGRHDFGLSLALIIFAFSIVGVPPTGGCFGKYYLLQGLWEKRDWTLLAPVGLTLLFNLWPAVRFLWLLFEHRKTTSFQAPIPFSAKAPLFLLALLTLVLGVFHQEIIQNFIEPALPKAYQSIHLPNVPFLGHEVE